MADEQKNKILTVRKNIDAIDSKILSLLKERIEYAKDIGRLKDENNRAKWDPLGSGRSTNGCSRRMTTPFPEDSLRMIFHEIITTCRLSQRNIEVAYLGPEATFSHLAGVKYFGHSATYKAQESIDDVFSEVEKGRTTLRHRAGRELHRGVGGLHPRLLHEIQGADLRRGAAGDQPQSGLPIRQYRGYPDGRLPRPAAGPVPGVVAQASADHPHPAGPLHRGGRPDGGQQPEYRGHSLIAGHQAV